MLFDRVKWNSLLFLDYSIAYGTIGFSLMASNEPPQKFLSKSPLWKVIGVKSRRDDMTGGLFKTFFFSQLFSTWKSLPQATFACTEMNAVGFLLLRWKWFGRGQLLLGKRPEEKEYFAFRPSPVCPFQSSSMLYFKTMPEKINKFHHGHRLKAEENRINYLTGIKLWDGVGARMQWLVWRLMLLQDKS